MPLQVNLANRLRKAGVKVIEHAGWTVRGSATFSPRGVLVHHTGPGSVDGLIKLVINGRPDLSGPLAQVVLAPDGTAHVVAAGRANHAGAGAWRGLSGNSVLWGIEAIHPGDQKTLWPQVQLEAYHLICAVMLDISGAGAEMAAGHKEYATPQGRKTDPVQLDMTLFRANVGLAMRKLDNAPVVQEVFKPMFDPPLQISAWVTVDYEGGGVVAVNAKGEIFCEPARLYIDAPASHPEYWTGHAPAVQIKAIPRGYRVVDHHGHAYDYVR